ncbi:MAG: hypothetical protein H0W02_19190 [Ktedonobacteraceae bacterium]|nr:hypothetical protein [Ktedonobacteraceae bacterium]
MKIGIGLPANIPSVRRELTDMGVDELILWPCIPNLDQVSRLEDLVNR